MFGPVSFNGERLSFFLSSSDRKNPLRVSCSIPQQNKKQIPSASLLYDHPRTMLFNCFFFGGLGRTFLLVNEDSREGESWKFESKRQTDTTNGNPKGIFHAKPGDSRTQRKDEKGREQTTTTVTLDNRAEPFLFFGTLRDLLFVFGVTATAAPRAHSHSHSTPEGVTLTNGRRDTGWMSAKESAKRPILRTVENHHRSRSMALWDSLHNKDASLRVCGKSHPTCRSAVIMKTNFYYLRRDCDIIDAWHAKARLLPLKRLLSGKACRKNFTDCSLLTVNDERILKVARLSPSRFGLQSCCNSDKKFHFPTPLRRELFMAARRSNIACNPAKCDAS